MSPPRLSVEANIVLNKITKALYCIVQALSVFFLAGMTLTVCIVVFGRYVLNSTPRWGEEVSLLCMVWFALLSAALPIWDNRHIRVTAWDLIVSAKTMRKLDLFVHSFLVVVILMIGWCGLELLDFVARSRMAGTGISFTYLYGAVPVSAVFMLIAAIQKLGEIFVNKP
ncbi:MAG: TRAP transporter small permease [Planctomycetes bacterium]|nr:TRAP transporter small permease [Planctomycetota bacterium]